MCNKQHIGVFRGDNNDMDKVGVNELITDFSKKEVDAVILEIFEYSFARKFTNPFIKILRS